MESNDQHHQMMDQYIIGNLTPEERMEFEHELRNNDDFAREFELHKEMVAGIRTYGNQQLKEELKHIHKKTVSRPVKVRKLWPRYAAAAVVVLLIAAGLWFFAGTKNNDQLFADYFQPYQISLSVRGDEAAVLKEAENAYLNGNFQEALPLLESAIEQSAYNSQLHLAAGISFLETDQYTQAIEQFSIIIDKNDPFLKDQAIWYSALTYLKLKNKNQATSLLRQLAEDENADKHLEAKELMAELLNG